MSPERASLEVVSGLLKGYRNTLEAVPAYQDAKGVLGTDEQRSVQWEDPFCQVWTVSEVDIDSVTGLQVSVLQPPIQLLEAVSLNIPSIGSDVEGKPYLNFARLLNNGALASRWGSDGVSGAERVLRRLQAGATPQRRV